MSLVDEFALSDAQKALWNAQSLDTFGSAYRVPVTMTIRGPLDRDRLAAALLALVQRHEALRTTFALTADGPVQRLQARAKVVIEQVDIPGEWALGLFIADQQARPMDIEQVTVRCAIARCAPDHHLLYLDLHHMICDGVSVGILATELQSLYRGDTLPEVDYQYVDWSEWKAATLKDTEDLAFWQNRLAILAPPPPLFASIAGDMNRAHTLQAHLTPPVWLGIRQAAKAMQVTSFEWLVSVLANYLSVATGVSPLTVAVPWFNREREEFQNTVGCFVDTAVLSFSPKTDRAFGQQLPILADGVREHLTHAGIGWSKLHSLWRAAWPDAGESPQPRVLFVLQTQLPALDRISDLTLSVDAPENGGAKYDLAVRIDIDPADGGGAHVRLEYRDTALDRTNAADILADLYAWWLCLSHDPQQAVAELPRLWLPAPLGNQVNTKTGDRPDLGAGGSDLSAVSVTLLQELCGQWAHTLNLDLVGPDDNFFSLGGDSILVLRLVAQLREQGLRIKPRDVFQYPTPRTLALARLQPSAATCCNPTAPSIAGDVLLPIEHWFFGIGLRNPNHWNQALALHLPQGQSAEVLHDALRQVHAAHAGFGLRWERGVERGWRLSTSEAGRDFVLTTTHSDLQNTESAQALHDCLHVGQGPLSALNWCVATGKLTWVVHHLAVDAVSWAILVKQLDNALQQTAALPPAVPNASRQARLQAAKLEAAREPQTDWAHEYSATAQLPGEPGRYADQQKCTLSLGPKFLEQASALTDAGFTLEELLLTALAKLLGSESATAAAHITLEHHGRDADSDHAASEVGWFTILAPLHLVWSREASALDVLSDVVPALARWRRTANAWLAWAQAAIGERPRLPSLSFNYLGRIDGNSAHGLAVEPLPDLPLHDPEGQRPFAHELLCWRSGNDIHITWLAPGTVPRAQVQAWLHHFRDEATSLVHTGATLGFGLPAGPLAPGLLYHHADDRQVKAAYTQQVCAWLDGPVHQGRLRTAWAHCVQRHEALRTAFRFSADGVLRRVIQPTATLPFTVIDLSRSGLQADKLFEQACEQERRAGFDFEQAPLGRVLLARFSDTRSQLAFTHHHAILDGWSLPVLLEDLLAHYDDPLHHNRQAHPMGGLAIVRAQSAADDEQLHAEWRKLLAQASDRGELALRSTAMEPDLDIDLVLDPALCERIASRAADHGVSMTTWYLAAWALALQVLGLGRTPIFGLTVSGRQTELHGIERHVGLTVNTLPLVLNTQPEQAFAALLQQVQARSAFLQASAHMSLSDVHRLAGARGEALFESLFVFENYPSGQMAGRDFTVGQVRMHEQAHYPLALAVLPGASTTLRLALRDGRVAASTGQTILEGLRSVLSLSSWRPDSPCAELRFHTAVNLGALLATARGAQATTSQGTLYALLERARSLWPDEIAVQSELLIWSYRELDKQARSAAWGLQALGLQPGQCVAFECARSAAWLAGVYGASFAGLAFVCIDPALPTLRRADMVQRSHAAMLVVDAEHQEEQATGLSVTRLDRLSQHRQVAARPAPTLADSLAYVVYTSGSSGRPKVVGVPQRGLHNLACAQATQAHLSAGDRVYQFASASFDAVVAEICMTAWAGARLCLPYQGLPIAQIDFVADLARTRPTHITLPPSLAASLEPGDFPGLRVMLVAGERSSASQLRALRDAGCLVINAYGPSEATVCATMSHWLDDQDPALGNAMQGVEVLVLDPTGQACPVGVAGELAIGGVGLAWGYLGDPVRTAVSFVPHPFPRVPGERLYLTGDRGLRDTSNQLVYLGRKDRQVKLRGQRIELGEIEACLGALPGVLAARVELRGQGTTARLVAWLQPNGGHDLNLALCAHAVAGRLPVAMVPQAWALIASWPLTALGKVDVSRLVEPVPLQRVTEGLATEAVVDTALLNAIVAIWRDAVGPQVHADDDFHQVGGDSISAMRVAARLATLGISVKARDLLGGLTPRRLLALAAPAAMSEPAPSQAAWSPIQARLMKHWQLQLPRWLLSVDIKLRASIDSEKLAAVIHQVASRHDALRVVCELSHEVLRRDEAVLPLMLRTHLGTADDLFQRLRAELQARSFQGLGAAVWDGSQPRLQIVVHHLWMDVVSLRLLVDEISEQLQPNAVPRPPATSFLTWAQALQTQAQAGHFDNELGLWLGVLNSPLPWTALVSGSPPTEAEVSHTQVEVTLAQNVPSDRWLEAVLLQSLAQCLAQPNTALLVECESHGRDALQSHDVSTTLGWFTAYYPLRLEPSEHALAQAEVLAGQLAALPAGGAGFGALHRWRKHLAGADRLAIFDDCCALSFNYLGAMDVASDAHDKHPLGQLNLGERNQVDVDPALRRLRPIAVEAWRTGRQMTLRWTYQRAQWPQADTTIAAVNVALLELLVPAAGQAKNAVLAAPESDLDDDELCDLMNALHG